jgi:hypothetical protein
VGADERDDIVERVATELRRPVGFDPAVAGRIMASVRSERVVVARPRRWVASVVGLAAAAGLVIGLSLTTKKKETVVEFALPVVDAHRVALVGDFNHWDVRATPLTLRRGGGWRVSVPLSPGRHVYAFVVDGTRWVVDPAAPRATDDDFGTPNSMVTVLPPVAGRGGGAT